MRCPRCGEIMLQGRWVDAGKFLQRIEPYIDRPGRGNFNGGRNYRINGVHFSPRDKDREVMSKIENKKRKHIHSWVAERILIRADLDPHIVDNILV